MEAPSSYPHNSVYITDKTCGCVRSLRGTGEGHLLGLRYIQRMGHLKGLGKDKACKGDMI